jgi:S1-C subfamily serine protease
MANAHRAQLGVRVTTVVDPTGQPVGMGVVSVVPSGPAAAAGIQTGEVITAVNNTPVHRASELAQQPYPLSVNATMPLNLTRGPGRRRRHSS